MTDSKIEGGFPLEAVEPEFADEREREIYTVKLNVAQNGLEMLFNKIWNEDHTPLFLDGPPHLRTVLAIGHEGLGVMVLDLDDQNAQYWAQAAGLAQVLSGNRPALDTVARTLASITAKAHDARLEAEAELEALVDSQCDSMKH